MTQRLRRRRAAYQRQIDALIDRAFEEGRGLTDAERAELARVWWRRSVVDARLYAAAERWAASPERENAPAEDEHRLVLIVEDEADHNPDGIRCGTFANLRPAEGA